MELLLLPAIAVIVLMATVRRSSSRRAVVRNDSTESWDNHPEISRLDLMDRAGLIDKVVTPKKNEGRAQLAARRRALYRELRNPAIYR